MWLEALRPRQWIKSGFCLAALFFSGLAGTLDGWRLIAPLLIGFSVLSSAGYLFNDIVNKEEDLRHPRKNRRPIASGRIKCSQALFVCIALMFIGLFVLSRNYGKHVDTIPVVQLGFVYLFVTFSYSIFFRKVPVADVLILGIGFVIRVATGAFALELTPTPWLLGCTYCIALMLGFGKRMGERTLLDLKHQEIGETRSALNGYTEASLQFLTGLFCFLAFFLYAGYCFVHPVRELALISVFPVAVGLLAYLRLAWRSEAAEMPESLFLRTPVLFLAVMFWLFVVTVIGVSW